MISKFLLKKIKYIFVILILCISLPSQARINGEDDSMPSETISSNTGYVYQIKEGEEAPFTGYLFDVDAIATMMAQNKYLSDKQKIEFDFQLKEKDLKLNLSEEKVKFLVEQNQILENKNKYYLIGSGAVVVLILTTVIILK